MSDARSTDKNAAPAVQYLGYPPYHSSPNVAPRDLHNPHICSCDNCAWMKTYQITSSRSPSLSPEAAEDDWGENRNTQPKPPKPQQNAKKNGNAAKVQKHQQQQQQQPNGPPFAAAAAAAAASAHPHPAMAYPEIYVYPHASHHLTFPVVDYTAAQRRAQQHPSSWPACYLAIAPHCARPADVEASLAPRGSRLVAVARLAKSKKTAPLARFQDIDDLREAAVQLEVWDEDAAKVPGPGPVPVKGGGGDGDGHGHRQGHGQEDNHAHGHGHGNDAGEGEVGSVPHRENQRGATRKKGKNKD
ncbi:hypothetical protein F4819DRAFT_491284 [Hypoxylon fuscum]|nr:hypothetical protein F4819DRAFT_491284 [Hypoxylon fuscum]